jgi:hypothetical protein
MSDDTSIISHDLSAGDTFEHKTMLLRCKVDEVSESGHVSVTTHRGDQHDFDRDLINRGLSEGFIERGVNL